MEKNDLIRETFSTYLIKPFVRFLIIKGIESNINNNNIGILMNESMEFIHYISNLRKK
jgi:hypothetical protein